MRVGRIRGFMGFGAVWPLGLWLMLTSRIHRKSVQAFLPSSLAVVKVGGSDFGCTGGV